MDEQTILYSFQVYRQLTWLAFMQFNFKSLHDTVSGRLVGKVSQSKLKLETTWLEKSGLSSSPSSPSQLLMSASCGRQVAEGFPTKQNLISIISGFQRYKIWYPIHHFRIPTKQNLISIISGFQRYKIWYPIHHFRIPTKHNLISIISARAPGLDFLDSFRTKGDCGVEEPRGAPR